jgi:threonine dehydratase
MTETRDIAPASDRKHALQPGAITRAGIEAAEGRIRPHVRRTPVIQVPGADFGLSECTLVLKLELLQHTGSFKPRGVFANLVGGNIPTAGVVAASGGNHGVAVAYAACRLGIPAKVFVPTVASTAKVDQIRRFGADLTIAGERYADALALSEEWRQASGALAIHAYDHPDTIMGQGTVGRELEQQADGVETVLVAVGGGGLIAGIAGWFADRVSAGAMRIIGVEPEAAPTLAHALKAGRPVDAPAGGIAADSLAPRRVGEHTFSVARESVHRVLLVPDHAIAAAQERLWADLRVAAEPGGAAAFAALLSGAYTPRPGERIGVVICGGNTTAVSFSKGASR